VINEEIGDPLSDQLIIPNSVFDGKHLVQILLRCWLYSGNFDHIGGNSLIWSIEGFSFALTKSGTPLIMSKGGIPLIMSKGGIPLILSKGGIPLI